MGDFRAGTYLPKYVSAREKSAKSLSARKKQDEMRATEIAPATDQRFVYE